MPPENLPKIDVLERGAPRGDTPQAVDRRLFVQLLGFGGCTDSRPLVAALRESAMEAVLYRDLNDPRGIGLLTLHEDPEFFVSDLREFLNGGPFRELDQKLQFSMFGRTYAIGREPELEDWLLRKPRRTVGNPDWRWALWYPLRRTGEFSRLSPKDQGSILMEHGGLGRAYAGAGLAADVRLACHGLDSRDNDFVIGLVGRDLHPLSHLVQAMRKTRQTSQYMQQMGPFFIGNALYQSNPKEFANPAGL